MTSVYKRVDRILPGETDQIEVDGVINKDGKVDDRFIDIERTPGFEGTDVDHMSDAYNRFWSAGVMSGGAISYTPGSPGQVDVAACQAILRIGPNQTDELQSVSVPAKSFSAGPGQDIEPDEVYYIFATIDTGPGATPTIEVSVSTATINCRDRCLMYTVVLDDATNQLFVLDGTAQNVDHNAKHRRRLFRTDRLARVRGGSFVGAVPGTLNWTLTSGTFFFGLSSIDHPDFDTNSGDTFTYFYRDGSGGWNNQTGQTDLTNNLWDDGSGTLQTLTDEAPPPAGSGTSYALSWLYVLLNSNGGPSGELAALYGQKNFGTVAEAEAASPPSAVPAVIEGTGVLVGRAIVEKNASEPTVVATTFGAQFVNITADQHNSLSGLQGGTTNLYEHSDQGINQVDTPQWNRVLAQYSLSGTATGDPSLPGFGFYQDNGVGMYRSAPDTLSFSTGGVEQVTYASDGDVVFNNVGALTLHRGNFGARPVSPVNGMMRYNTTDDVLEFHVDGNWQQLGGSSGTGDFVHRYGDTMTGNLNVNATTTGSTITTNGSATFTNDTAFIDLVPTGAGAKARLGLDSANQSLELFVLNSAGGTFTIPGLVIDNSISTQDVRPGTNEVARLGTGANKWANVISAKFTANAGTASQPSYTFSGDPDTGMYRSGANELTLVSGTNGYLTVRPTGVVDITSTAALTLPNGTTAQRPGAPDQGMVRYNSSQSTFEGYDGANWRGLGGVIDVDQDTFIRAETSPGVDNDVLQFYAGGTLRLAVAQSSSTFYGDWFLASGATLQATYADLAERYEADMYYEPGTVLVIGGDKEVTVTTTKEDRKVIGVVSTNPAHLMNAAAGNDETHPPIALAGRIPVRVYGYIEKGDMLVTGEKHGTAVATNHPIPGTVIGKALENYHSDQIGFIEMVVRPS